MKPIILYFRVSTMEQNIQSQVDDLNKWATANNYKVINSYGETVSGYDISAERLEYDKMKDYVLKHNINDIAVWEISRFSRSLKFTVNEIDFFTKHNVNIHFRKENLETISNNVTNQLLISILSSMAQMERDTFIERGNRGRMSAVLRGRMIGYSTPPYGYTSDENKLIMIEPTEAKVIKLIYEMAAKGDTLYSISQHLNSLNIPTRRKLQGKKRTLNNGKKIEFFWKPSPISRMIKKTLYKGLRIYHGIDITIPAIVSENVWNTAQKRFTDNIGLHNRTKYEYLFKSKMKCGKCGRTLVTYKLKTVNYAYYLCSGIIDEGIKCDNGRYINSKMIDDNLYKCLFNSTYIKEIMTRDTSPELEKSEKLKQIVYYNNEIETLEMKQKRYTKLVGDGYITYEEYEKETLLIKNTKIDFANKINIVQSEIHTLNKIEIDDVIKTYKNTKDWNVKRDFVNRYVNEIKIYKVDMANVDWPEPLHKNEKIIYVEMKCFNYNIPLKILLTPYSKNVMISRDLEYLPDYNMIVDIKNKMKINGK